MIVMLPHQLISLFKINKLIYKCFTFGNDMVKMLPTCKQNLPFIFIYLNIIFDKLNKYFWLAFYYDPV